MGIYDNERGAMSERERRQYTLMRDKLSEFHSGALSIGSLIDSLSALLDNTEDASTQWLDEFREHWWTLEQIYAVELDREEQGELPPESLSLVSATVSSLQKLVEKALMESKECTSPVSPCLDG